MRGLMASGCRMSIGLVARRIMLIELPRQENIPTYIGRDSVDRA